MNAKIAGIFIFHHLWRHLENLDQQQIQNNMEDKSSDIILFTGTLITIIGALVVFIGIFIKLLGK